MNILLVNSVLIVLSHVSSLPILESRELKLNPLLEDIVRNHLRNDGPLVQDDIHINNHHLLRLNALSINHLTLRSFTVFRNARIESLRLYNCEIGDFSSIRFLPGIKELHLRNCRIKNISSLANLSELKHLSLTDNNIEDISALSKCKGLIWLDLHNNRIDSVSTLRQLKNLFYVDLRNNPLNENSFDSDIKTIKANNPNIHILMGKQSSVKENIEQYLSARAKIAEFGLCSRLQYEDGLIFPSLPNISNDISDALRLLGKGDDKEYLSDIATLLMRYVIEIETYYRPGPVFSRGENPLLDAFLDGVGLEVSEEGIPALSVGNWICSNRNNLSPSLVLDKQIERRLDIHTKLRRKGIYGTSNIEEK